MAFRWGLLRTRVARRILLLFVIGALLPIGVMAAISLVAVDAQLERQSEERLGQLTKNAGQSILQQLLMVEAALRNVARAVDVDGGSPQLPVLPPAVVGLAHERAGRATPLLGTPPAPVALDAAEAAALSDPVWRMVLKPRGGPDGRFLAAIAADSATLEAGVLWAAVEPDTVWTPAVAFASLPTVSDVCIVDADGEAFYCRSGGDALVRAYRAARTEGDASGASAFRASVADAQTVIGRWTVFLAPAFATAPWTILVAEETETLYAPLASFRYSFVVALLLGLLAVLLLANVQVRRTMTPLEALTEGTQRIAGGDLETRVPVSSGDEFGVLADSFNEMAGRLDVQFRQLEAAHAIDQAVLSATDRRQVVEALLQRFGGVVECRSLAVVLTEPGSTSRATLHWAGQAADERVAIGLSPSDQAWLRQDPHSRVVGTGEQRPEFASWSVLPLPRGPLVVLPLLVQDQLRGSVLFVPPEGQVLARDALERARQVADQAAIALDQLRLLGELEEMNWGTLRALARAIDAKSRWTAGHSERVTALSLRIGEAMGLDEAQLDVLNRGGLLHDVGKIGVPASVLDFAGGLSRADRELIEQHPVIGGRILEPIKAFAPALPIVVQHHERWDGKGYPDGLRGLEIHPLARILTVADVYDAMASARPYRGSLDEGVVLAEIRAGSGTHFEPRVVEAFLEMMAAEGKVPNPRRGVPAHG